MSRTSYIKLVKVAIRSAKTIIFASKYQIRCLLRANLQGGVCGILLG
jgi:hypothetical protein